MPDWNTDGPPLTDPGTARAGVVSDAMLEAGLVRSKNAATICLKNIALYSVAGLMVYFIGYDLIYGIAEGGFIAPLNIFWGGDESGSLGWNSIPRARSLSGSNYFRF